MTLGNDNGTDGQTDRRTDRRTDRVRRNMRPPPREEGRIIKQIKTRETNATSHEADYFG